MRALKLLTGVALLAGVGACGEREEGGFNAGGESNHMEGGGVSGRGDDSALDTAVDSEFSLRGCELESSRNYGDFQLLEEWCERSGIDTIRENNGGEYTLAWPRGTRYDFYVLSGERLEIKEAARRALAAHMQVLYQLEELEGRPASVDFNPELKEMEGGEQDCRDYYEGEKTLPENTILICTFTGWSDFESGLNGRSFTSFNYDESGKLVIKRVLVTVSDVISGDELNGTLAHEVSHSFGSGHTKPESSGGDPSCNSQSVSSYQRSTEPTLLCEGPAFLQLNFTQEPVSASFDLLDDTGLAFSGSDDFVFAFDCD